jgi:hypothetical protein
MNPANIDARSSHSAKAFELHAPGSFPLCIEPAMHAEATGDLKFITATVQNAMRPFPMLALILTGSVARGEGALIADPANGSRWLSDLEFQVLIPDGRSVPERAIGDALRDTQQAINSTPTNQERGLRVGFNALRVSQLRRLRPAIFSREMLEHGKLVLGDATALSAPPWWRDGRIDIPCLDAFRLLNNRIVQKLDARLRYEAGGDGDLLPAYTLQKFWIEMATSLSVFLGCYRTSYRERRTALSDCLASQPELFGELGRLIVTRLSTSIDVKLGRCAPPRCSDERFDEAAYAAASVWNWEASRLLGCPPDGDWRSIPKRFRWAQPYTQSLRDWARLLVRGMSDDEFTRNVKAAIRAGSLANAIYQAACLLDFYWTEVGTGSGQGPMILATASKLFGLDPPPASDGRRSVAKAVIARWDRHLRFAPR